MFIIVDQLMKHSCSISYIKINAKIVRISYICLFLELYFSIENITALSNMYNYFYFYYFYLREREKKYIYIFDIKIMFDMIFLYSISLLVYIYI